VAAQLAASQEGLCSVSKEKNKIVFLIFFSCHQAFKKENIFPRNVDISFVHEELSGPELHHFT
jgi:hypothetical protein